MDVIKTYDGKQLAAYSDVNGRRLELTIDDDNKVAAIGGRELAGGGGGSVDFTILDAVGGPGVAVDNPDGNSMRVSFDVNTLTDEQVSAIAALLQSNATLSRKLAEKIGIDETILYEGVKNIGDDGGAVYTLTESPENFKRVRVIYQCCDNSSSTLSNVSSGCTELDMDYINPYTYIHMKMNGSGEVDGFTTYDVDAQLRDIRTTTWSVKARLSGASTNAKWFHIVKIIGIGRRAEV